jgi:peroxiredoxin
MAMRRAFFALAAAALLLVAGCSGGGAGGAGFTFHGATPAGKLIAAGDRKPAGQFTSELLDGQKFTLAQTKGKVVVLNYWASWCSPCRDESPDFSALYQQVKSKGILFYGVDTDDVRAHAQTFVDQYKISYPSLFDEDGSTELKLGNIPSTTLPHTILLDRQGRVAAVYIAKLTSKDLEGPLATLAAEH